MKNIFLCLFICLISFSCKPSPEKVKGVIPQETFTHILKDIHLTDGAMSRSQINRPYRKMKDITIYDTIFEKHGYTREDFQHTVTVYSSFTPEFEKVYKNVISLLNQDLEKVIKQKDSIEAVNYKTVNNLWRSQKNYTISMDTLDKIDDLSKKIQVKSVGKYYVEADYTFYSKDQCKNPSVNLQAFYKDSLKKEIITASEEFKLKKKSNETHQLFTFEIKDTLTTHFYVNLLKHKLKDSTSIKHFEIKNIFVYADKKNKKINKKKPKTSKVKNKTTIDKTRLLNKTKK